MPKQKTVSKILKLKDSKKKEVEMEVKKAADKVDEENTKLQSLENNFTDMLRFFNEKQEEGSLDANNLISCYDFFSRINGKINEQKKVHAQCQDELTCLKDTLVSAYKDKKVVEILHEKIIKREHKEKLNLEQKENDFFAISRRSR
ncbi:MAG: flagellar export protein FliJ [Nitrospirae bacterium]|nr:flagellar export protein FliJ [Nitrospirota bacterium]